MVLAEARRALDNGQIDEAERLAQVAELIQGPRRWFAPGDSPEKLQNVIRIARSHNAGGPTVGGDIVPVSAVTPVPAAVATVRTRPPAMRR